MSTLYTINSTSDEVISVSQLNKLAKATLENNLPIMWIRGEISGLKTYAHVYFDLKDSGGKISCVIFAKLAGLLDFPLENGLQIEVRGRVTIYPQNGSYQINVERARKVGLGELWEAYTRLIVKLRAEGLFDQQHKKSIPIFPKAIGVITSKEGAVIRDVISTLARRMPNIPIIIYHSAVQGTDAGMQLVKALRTANSRLEVDVLIVCRGGGSMEDLCGFNEEGLAREVFMSQIPIISAVGHETDTTIIDFVADLRAPTPTAAAELVAKSRNEWQNLVQKLNLRLANLVDKLLNDKQQRLDLAIANMKSINPMIGLKNQQQYLMVLTNRLRQESMSKLENYRWQINLLATKLSQRRIDIKAQQKNLLDLNIRLRRNASLLIKIKQVNLNNLEQKLNLVNPSNILSRGYAIIRDNNGKLVSTTQQTKHHARVEINLKDGRVSAIIDKKFNKLQDELL